MPVRDAFDEQLHARIESIYESLEHHEAHLESTESTSMDSHLEALRQLKEKRRHIDGLAQRLEDAGEHGWEQIRERIDAAIEELKRALEAARARLNRDK